MSSFRRCNTKTIVRNSNNDIFLLRKHISVEILRSQRVIDNDNNSKNNNDSTVWPSRREKVESVFENPGKSRRKKRFPKAERLAAKSRNRRQFLSSRLHSARRSSAHLLHSVVGALSAPIVLLLLPYKSVHLRIQVLSKIQQLIGIKTFSSPSSFRYNKNRSS